MTRLVQTVAVLAGADNVWLEIVVDGTDIITPRTQLGAVPYAASASYAAQCTDADTLDGQHADAFAPSAHAHTTPATTAATLMNNYAAWSAEFETPLVHQGCDRSRASLGARAPEWRRRGRHRHVRFA